MQSKQYDVSGMGSQTFQGLEDYSTLNMSGMGAVTINGHIGEHATINFSGMGALTIAGTVSDTVNIHFSGMGALNFRHRPSETVLSNIHKSGFGNVNVPGGYREASYQQSMPQDLNIITDSAGKSRSVTVTSGRGSTTVFDGDVYCVGGTTTFIDDRGVVTTLPPHTNMGNVTVYGNRYVMGAQQQPPAPRPNPQMNQLSEATTSFLQRLDDKVKFSETLTILELSEAEKLAFNEFLDPITHVVMDNPVLLNDRCYDLSTIERLPVNASGYRKDPYTNQQFCLANLQPALRLSSKFDEIVSGILTAREELKAKLAHVQPAIPSSRLVQDVQPVLAAAPAQAQAVPFNAIAPAYMALVARQQPAPAPVPAPVAAAAPPAALPRPENQLSDDYTEDTKGYIASFEGKQKNTEIFDSLKITEEEEEDFKDYIDCQTLEVMNIPVSVHGTFYDLPTLANQKVNDAGQREAPLDRKMYLLRDIQAGRFANNQIQKLFTRFSKNRAEQQPGPAIFNSYPKPAAASPVVPAVANRPVAKAAVNAIVSSVQQAPQAAMFKQPPNIPDQNDPANEVGLLSSLLRRMW